MDDEIKEISKRASKIIETLLIDLHNAASKSAATISQTELSKLTEACNYLLNAHFQLRDMIKNTVEEKIF